MLDRETVNQREPSGDRRRWRMMGARRAVPWSTDGKVIYHRSKRSGTTNGHWFDNYIKPVRKLKRKPPVQYRLEQAA